VNAYRLTPRALADLEQIADYSLEARGEAQTERYLEAIMQRLQWLTDNPLLGKPRDEIAPGYRSFRQGSYIVFYVMAAGDIHIIGVPHAAMDVDAHFED
jgi:toxin ParE1/3/4